MVLGVQRMAVLDLRPLAKLFALVVDVSIDAMLASIGRRCKREFAQTGPKTEGSESSFCFLLPLNEIGLRFNLHCLRFPLHGCHDSSTQVLVLTANLSRMRYSYDFMIS